MITHLRTLASKLGWPSLHPISRPQLGKEVFEAPVETEGDEHAAMTRPDSKTKSRKNN
jgi:hypothetical protein